MQRPEILSPAGGMEQLTAAVAAGTDAVYLGAKAFNARMGADNFTSLNDAVAYCHARGVKVYVTLNTLFMEAETPRLIDTLREIAESGADGMLATDAGTIRLWRMCCPDLPIHASTQMTVHSPAGARLVQGLGFSRAVLAREMSREEIRQTAEAVPGMEIEAFVHGALCMSVSGQCFISSMLGGRSGNRGQCAQPCRLDFACGGRRYALSLKDLSLISRARELGQLGVTSLKIEGRLKRPEYAAAAVMQLRRALDGEEPDLELLETVFSRSGFTSGYYDGVRNAGMFGHRTREDAEGEKEACAYVRSQIRVPHPRIACDMEFILRAHAPASLVMRSGGRTVTVTGPEPSPAESRPLDRDRAVSALSKLGGTPFYAGDIRTDIEAGLFLPGSAVNGMRAEAAEKLQAALAERKPWHFAQPKIDLKASEGEILSRAFLTSRSQLTDEVAALFDRVYLPAAFIDAEMVHRYGGKLCARAERFSFGLPEEKQLRTLQACAELGVAECAVSGLAGIQLCREAGLAMTGECTLGILNSLALSEYASWGLTSSDVSMECTLANLRAITPVIPIGAAVYGHLPLMTFRACPARGVNGCGACDGHPQLRDRYQETFPMLCCNCRYSVMLNPHPLYMGDIREELPGHVSPSFYFYLESAEECAGVKRTYDAGEKLSETCTRALYKRKLL